MAAIQGYLGAVYVKTGASAAFTNQATTNVGGDLKTYEITDTTKRYWDTRQPVTVQTSPDGITWTTVTTGFKIEYPGGRVVFNTAQAAGTQVRVSASAYTVSSIAAMFNWQMDIERDTEDTPTFGSAWNDVTPLIPKASGSCEWYWADGQFFSRMGDSEMVFALYTNSTNKYRYEFYGTFTKSASKTPVDGVVTESLDFQSSGPIYYRVG